MTSLSQPANTDNLNSALANETIKANEESTETNKTVSEPVVVPAKIKAIEVRFTKAIKDIKNRIIPVGTATATYTSGSALTTVVSGGSHVPTYGITDPVKSLAIFRVENSQYLNHNGDPMPYALFYHGGEALHVGRTDKTSHGCVHVADVTKMKKMNEDTVKNKTTVTVLYDTGVLEKVMKQHL